MTHLILAAATLLAALLFTAGTGCRTKPECFECGLNEEWARAEKEEQKAQAESAEAASGPEVEAQDPAELPRDTQPPPACDQDSPEAQECAPGFVYGRPPIPYCSGVRPTAEQERARHEREQAQPCHCYDQEAIFARIRECGKIPSARPSGANASPDEPTER